MGYKFQTIFSVGAAREKKAIKQATKSSVR